MELPKLDLKPANILKVVGFSLIGIVILAVIFTVLSMAYRSFQTNTLLSPSIGYGMMGVNTSAVDSYGGASPELSVRNIAPMPPIRDGGTPGNTAEQFEVTNYYADIETRDLAGTCKQIFDLKPKAYVIFENATDGKHSCSYTFKVEREYANEVVTLLKTFDPKNFTENTSTIKRTLDDFTSEIDILTKKKDTVEQTLKDAVASYDEISVLATKTQNADTLAKIIESKLQILERLTQERININAQLDQLGRSKAEQLDKLKYTFFTVNVTENRYLDIDQIKDSWKLAVKTFVMNVNDIAQNISINLVAILLFVIQCLVYFFILLFIAKFGWKATKAIWKK